VSGKRQSRLQLSQLEVFSRCLNAKSEYRNPKQYQNSNQKFTTLQRGYAIVIKVFENIICFEFRIWSHGIRTNELKLLKAKYMPTQGDL